jgi:hypothetical protein
MPTTSTNDTRRKAGPERPSKAPGFSQAQDGLPKGQSMTGNEQIDDNLDELGRDINSGDIEAKHHPQAALERGLKH